MFFKKYYHARWVVYEIFGIKIKKKIKPTHIDTVNLILGKNFGIGNRIFAIVNAIYGYSPKNLNIYWDKDGWVDESFSSLFECNFDCKITEYNDEKICKTWKNSKDERTIESPQTNLLTSDLVERILINNNITPEIEKEFKEIFSKVQPTEKIKKRIKSINLPEKFVALQIRNAPDWQLYGRNESLNSFIEAIKKCPKDTVFYISSMSKEVSDFIKENSDCEIIELPEKNYKSMTDAMADLYIMSYAQKGIYSFGSTFGELAWWLSKTRQEYSIIGSYANWKWIKEDKK